VTTTRTVKAFNHYTVGGALEVEDEQVLAEAVDDVSCRWCGHGRAVEVLPDAADASEAAVHGADQPSAQ